MPDTARRLVYVTVFLSAMILFWWLILPEGPSVESGWTVESVVDGDTIDVSRDGVTETVRLIGIDTPEREQCGYQEASDFLSETVLGQEVTLLGGATTDRDTYGRLLRYVEFGGLDVGLAQIAEGFAIARYDSRTDQPHPREDLYREADDATEHICGLE